MQKIGSAVSAAGYVSAPFTEGAGLALVPIGSGIEKNGTAVQFGLDIHDGKFKDAAFSFGLEVVFGNIGNKVDKALDAGKITKTDKGIIGAVSDAWGKVSDFFYDKRKERKYE